MDLKQITAFEDFLQLRDQWNRLVEATDVDHAFMKHEWFECWIRHLMPTGKLAIFTAWEDDKLIALAPLQIVRRVRKKIPLRILSFLRSGVSPRSNFIIADSIDSAHFFEALFSIRGWDVGEFRSMEHESSTTKKFVSYLEENSNYVIEKGIQSPHEVFETDWESYLNSKSKKYRRHYRWGLNRLEKAGDYKVIKLETADEIEQWFDSIVEVSSKSWKGALKTDLKSMSRMSRFYREFSRLGAKNRLFVAYLLLIEDTVVAFSYYLRHRNRLACIRWDYDEEYAYFMPGINLHHYCLKEAIDSGTQWEYDLCGMASAHKERLVNNVREHINITAGRPGLVGGLAMFFKRALMPNKQVGDDHMAPGRISAPQ